MQPVYPVPSCLAEHVIPSYLVGFLLMKVLIKSIYLYKALLCLLVKHPLDIKNMPSALEQAR